MSASIAERSGRSRGDLVFISYSRQDAVWRQKFEVMLAPVVRNRGVEVWSDDRNAVGEEWRPQLVEAINRATLALVLVSADLLASPFVMQQELPALRERGVRLACALVGDCLYWEEPMLERVQWAHDPGRDGPLAGRANSAMAKKRIVLVCREIGTLLKADRAYEASTIVSAAPRLAAVAQSGGEGPLDGVPALPSEYVARDDLATLRLALLGEGTGAVGVTGQAPLGLHGQGGIGKTVLATALARDPDVRRAFPDGVFWITLGEQADHLEKQRELLRRLGAAANEELRTPSQGVKLLREVLRGRRFLLIVDDVWSAVAAAAFRVTGEHGRVLYTTRNPAVLDEVRAQVERVDVLAASTARRLLGELTGVAADALPSEVDAVLEATGCVALAVAMVGAAIGRGGRAWSEVVRELRTGRETFLDHPYANTFKAMQVALSGLEDPLRTAYESLAVFPEDTRIPTATIERLWAWLYATPGEVTRERLATLAKRRLLSFDDDTIAFHDLQHDFLLLEIDDLMLCHDDLLGAYRPLLPSGTGSR